MTSRFSLLALGFSLLACQMDNPAFEGGDELADASDGSSDGPDVGELGEGEGESTSTNTSTGTSTNDGMDDVDSSSDAPDVTDDASSTTEGDCMPGSQCGTCHVCDMNGECVPDVGASCGDQILHCGQYLFGASESTCYALVDTQLPGSCTEQGVCEPPSPMNCPFVKGEAHFACDPVCVTNPQACEPYQPAANVDLGSMCAVQAETDGCHAMCLNGSVEHAMCMFGQCDSMMLEICNPFACNADNATCYMTCETNLDCAPNFFCENSNCVMG